MDDILGLQGKRVVITGASGGLGAVLVRRFAETGARVVGCDLPDAALDDLPLDDRHGFDITEAAAVVDAAAAIVEAGAPDAVISNAGWTRAESFTMLGPNDIGRELEINYSGAARLTHALLPAMRERGGVFVFVASVNALAHFGNPAYSAAKAGLMAWARAIATEEGRHGIRANVVAPGSIRTPGWDHRIARDPRIMERVSALYPLGRLVEPREVADAVLFLASPLASGITGATLPVDAGLMGGNMPFLRLIEP